MELTLGVVDIAVLAASLAAVLVIGVRASAKTRDMESYLLGDRDLPWWAILGSIVATETSTATVLSVPGIGFSDVGMKFLQLTFGYIVGRMVVVRMLLPLYFEGRLYTAYQVLERRFGGMTERAASLLFLITRNLGDGLRLFLAAIVLQQLTGWSFGWSVVAMGTITIVYTCMGGMRSVIWNDCLQLLIYMTGGVAVLFVIANHISGSWNEVFRYAAEHQKLRVIDWNFSWIDPYNFWAGLIGGAVLTLGTHGADHMMVQRYLSARSQRDAARAVVLSGFVVCVQFALFLAIGVQLAAYYAQRPEISFEKTDEVFAHFIVHEFPRNTGLVGLMLSAILAAAMSTLSSSLNSSASALMNDFLTPLRTKPFSDRASLSVTRWLTVLFGVVQMAIGYFALYLSRSVVANALTIAGFSAGLLLGVYALGVLTKSVGQRAALIGAAFGLLTLLVVQFGPQVNIWMAFNYGTRLLEWDAVAFPWLPVIGASTTFVVGWVAGRFIPRTPAASL